MRSRPSAKILSPVLSVGFVIVVASGVFVGLTLHARQTSKVTATPAPTAPADTSAAASPILPTPTPTPSPISAGSTNDSSLQVLSGSLKPISEDLGLVSHLTPEGDNPDYQIQVKYYSAGSYASGPYAGYERIVAVRSPEALGDNLFFTFATKDRKTYVMGGDPKVVADGSYVHSYGLSGYTLANADKITSIAELPTSLPSLITLNGTYGLIRASTPQDHGIESYSSISYTDISLITDFSGYDSLTSPNSHLHLYTPSEGYADKSLSGTGDTSVYAVDSTGLAARYSYARLTDIRTYQAASNAYAAKDLAFQLATAKDPNTSNNNDLDYPMLPGLDFKSKDISGNDSTSLFASYGQALPQICGRNEQTTLTMDDASSKSLIAVGTVGGTTVYRIANPASDSLVKQEYEQKVGWASENPSSFSEINTGKSLPTLAEYVAKNPVLLMKDYWGRWVALGEYDYQMIGGCGKPVVYVYPTQPTKVSLSFAGPMQLTTAIPSYHGGWSVLAQPDGSLTDLQPQYTDCSTINPQKLGSEYATSACAANSYPYIYWAGTSLNKAYPVADGGWVVNAADLQDFLNSHLGQIGLTAKEKGDMLSYWLPELQSKHAPYYRISFLTTAQMNSLAPMRITPTPDSLLRVFLDWEPLTEKPATPPVPQKLTPFERTGFSVVEWGGLKR